MENKRTAKIIKKKNLGQWVKPASGSDPVDFVIIEYPKCLKHSVLYTTQNLLRITFSFNDLMLKTNQLKKDFFIKIG